LLASVYNSGLIIVSKKRFLGFVLPYTIYLSLGFSNKLCVGQLGRIGS